MVCEVVGNCTFMKSIVSVQIAETVPFNVKSSNLNVPEPEAPLKEITTVIVPVWLLTALETVVVPISEPLVGTVPLPTLIPLMVMSQF